MVGAITPALTYIIPGKIITAAVAIIRSSITLVAASAAEDMGAWAAAAFTAAVVAEAVVMAEAAAIAEIC